MLPSIFSSGVTQINILVGTIIASFKQVLFRIYTMLIRGTRLILLSLELQLAQYHYQLLSHAFKQKILIKFQAYKINQSNYLCLLSLPASLGLIIASEEIINSLFGYGSFSTTDVDKTSSALIFFGYGIIAFALVKILANFFFAQNNTKTPFYISSFIVFLNIFNKCKLF